MSNVHAKFQPNPFRNDDFSPFSQIDLQSDKPIFIVGIVGTSMPNFSRIRSEMTTLAHIAKMTNQPLPIVGIASTHHFLKNQGPFTVKTRSCISQGTSNFLLSTGTSDGLIRVTDRLGLWTD